MSDDALIKEMLKAFKTISVEFGEVVAMRVVLGVARKAIMGEAAGAIERLIDTDKIRRECCGNGVQSCYDEPPECCGDPDLLVTISDAAATIRSLANQGQTDG